MKYIIFNDKKVDTELVLQLQSLASILSGIEDLKFRFDFGHYLNLNQNVIAGSRFWDNLSNDEQEAGLKTDIYLRSIGTLKYTNHHQVRALTNILKTTHLKKMGIQLFTCIEDLRLEEICKRDRPGTSVFFKIRRQVYYSYFESQLIVNTNRGYDCDALFCAVFITLYSDVPDPKLKLNSNVMYQLDKIKSNLFQSFETRDTKDVVQIIEEIILLLTPNLERDSINEYFVLPIMNEKSIEAGMTLEDIQRKNKLENVDHLNRQSKQEEAKREKMPMWHREQKISEQEQSYLSFDLESGTRIPLLGGTARESESEGDEALGAAQGKAKSSKESDFSEQQLQEGLDSSESTVQNPYGRENQDVSLFFKEAHPPSQSDQIEYEVLTQSVGIHITRLEETIEKTLEYKRTEPRKELLFGRLSNKLISLVLEPYPRIFQKKESESREIDAAFTLLIDCSASMFGKMDDTKKGIALFHEVLRKLRIPHTIVGFWEDASAVHKGYQPNYFHMIKNFQQSIYSRSGAEIMQLEPQEDNRDGLSIRVVTEELHKRGEKNKFLLVFSDGEPAADGYHQNGIIDTKEAVIQARKRGVEVIGMFLSDEIVSESDQKTMQNIYGKEHLIIPDIAELPESFASLLKRLLFKSI